MLTYKAELVGIQVVASKVSSTSQASFLDGDPLPVYDPAHLPPLQGAAGQAGLYRASDGRHLNADVNGAFNSMRQGVPDAFANGIEGVVVHPVRMTLANGPHGSHVHVA
jgi:putative transposase